MTPEISVIIPTHNRRAMLREALASVGAQRGASFEIIVVDDGSTDGTWQDLSGYDQSARRDDIRATRTGRRGPAAARNRGIAMARGALIAFLDSDDLWMPEKLAHQGLFMRNNPDCAISQTGETWLRDGRRVNPGRRHRKRPGDIFADALRTCLISPSAVVLRRGLLDQVGGFDEDMAACEDYDLWLRILTRHQVGLLDEPLAVRRAGHPGQLSTTVPALDRFRILALAKLLADVSLNAAKRTAAAAVMAGKCLIYGKGLARRNRHDDAAFFAEAARSALERWSREPDAALEAACLRMRAMLRRSKSADAPTAPAMRQAAERVVTHE
ncbi:MAG TPA: glycosyltransferase family A protein [Candidatus Binataceae bacterium]|nr:glycosyltransferase family A protein [Candidatus Binataceae bacterium]